MAAGAQQPSIVPTELEQQIFGRLLDVVHHGGLGTQLRVAGGWVRDKLLGKNSTDIDIALDDLTGKEFCEKITDYYEKVISHELKTPCVIPCKPGQSKHLETAKIILSDISDITIDFVNLRSEKYAENSRIPTAEYGMPEEDAFRRDLTINSLFYNINTNLVEDLTRRGLEDLKKGLIVTPLPAKVTFLDDPLRVLRAIRFAARFSFTLAENLKEAASDEKVKLNLRSKISRERIGQEVDHMMSGKYPVDAMCHIRDLGLFYIVFAFPEKTVPPVLDKHDWLCVSHIEAAWNLAQSIGCSVFRGGSGSMSQDEQRRLCMYSALFTPVRNMVYTKKKEVVRYIIGNSLKLNGSDAEAIVQIHAASDKFADLIIFLESNGNLETVKENLEKKNLEIPTDMVARVLAGLLLLGIKDLWRLALLISTLSYPEVRSANGSFSQQDELNRRKEIYIRVERLITDLDLEGAWKKIKPLLDGNDIMGVLDIEEGPLVKEWKERLVKWQLAHPKGTAEECREWIKQSKCQEKEM
ncbi:tRNA nucleotidyltransferase cca2-like [Aegilops tauschii subsp. strangulata]|uniref:tRNA nucleotidyltransferase cca2-like n=1 Tax=Aegilops tauschii subsp. strangulata TaxID=200361 RepID=UPI00098A7354|nr:tRNA nucleotidyltransferase cca2-like [Aegilops tauschii subsp. strangulata]